MATPSLAGPQSVVRTQIGRVSSQNRNQFVVVDDTDTTYYAGTDIYLYFDGVLIDEIVNVQYQLIENVMPIYPYADYIYKKAARGTRMVQGSFTMNFRKSGYLFSLMKFFEGESVTSGEDGQILNPTAQQLPTTPDVGIDELADSLSGVLSPEDAAEVAQSFRQRFWAQTDPSVPDEVARNYPIMGAGDDGFSLLIRYGNPAIDDSQVLQITNDKQTGLPARSIGTEEKIRKVQLTGYGKAIDDSGRNILETYTFVAQDIENGIKI